MCPDLFLRVEKNLLKKKKREREALCFLFGEERCRLEFSEKKINFLKTCAQFNKMSSRNDSAIQNFPVDDFQFSHHVAACQRTITYGEMIF